MRYLKFVFLTFICISLIACSTFRVIADGQDATTRLGSTEHAGLRVGDIVELQFGDGRKAELQVTLMDSEGIEGRADKSSDVVRFQWSTIGSISRRDVDAGKTTVLVLAALGAVVVWVHLATRAMASNIAASLPN